jgi:hypothetical protein
MLHFIDNGKSVQFTLADIGKAKLEISENTVQVFIDQT